MFKTATREQNRLRLAIDGPSGCGKTYTALRLAVFLAHLIKGDQGRVAVIDTEHHTASKYIGESPDGIPWQWESVDLAHFSPSTYEEVIKEAGRQGYDVLVIDSLSHAWQGVGGALDQVDKYSGSNRFAAWRDVSPQQTAMIDSIINSPCHVIVTMRSKMEYVMEQDDKGKTTVSKVGLKPIQREGVEYEFDIVADMDVNHTLRVSKSRCSEIDGKVVNCPTGEFVRPIHAWLFSGVPGVASVDGNTGGNGAMQMSTRPPGATDHQAKELKRLCQALDWTPDKLRGVLAKKDARRISDLSEVDAQSLLCRLTELDTRRQANVAF